MTGAEREYHSLSYSDRNPVLAPDKPWEKSCHCYTCCDGSNGLPVGVIDGWAAPFSGGAWWDPLARHYRLYYNSGFPNPGPGIAVSNDSLTWTKPLTGAMDTRSKLATNWVFGTVPYDGATVWLDIEPQAKPEERWKMILYPTQFNNTICPWCSKPNPDFGSCSGDSAAMMHWPTPQQSYACRAATMVSADGVHWNHVSNCGPSGDRSSLFFNPFRQVWVYSIRTGGAYGRSRGYWESKVFGRCNWPGTGLVWTTGADDLDNHRVGDTNASQPKQIAQVYNRDAVAYDSLMVFFLSLYWPSCRADNPGHPECTVVYVGFSRDGWHFTRTSAPRVPFAPWGSKPGDWNYGDIQSVGGGFIVEEDELRTFVSGRSGMRANGTLDHGDGMTYTGFGTLRRDVSGVLDSCY
jgi:hypothetical protein